MKIRILAFIRTGKTSRYIAAFIALNIFLQCVSPTIALALTSGPAQEEFASFEPATTTDMVDIYSGDFNYNIPLLSVPGPNGGYPLNLSYHSGIGMEQESSWVGLGWSLNVGAINRQLRGLPDDLNGEEVYQKMHLKKNITVGIDLTKAKQREVFGVPKPTKDDNPNALKWQIYYNTYKGLGYRVFANIARENQSSAASVSVGISYDSQGGLGIEPNMSLAAQYGNGGLSFNLGASYNSRQGVTDFSFSSSVNGRSASEKKAVCQDDCQTYTHNVSGMGYGASSTLSYSTSQSVPTVTIPMRTETYPFDIKVGQEKTFGNFTAKFPGVWKGFVSYSDVDNDGIAATNAYGYLHTAEATDNDMRDFQRNNIEYSKKIPNLPISTFTYDLYTQTGQGTGSMFRPFYSSIGILSNPKRKSKDIQTRLNLEAGASTKAATTNVHVGLGFTRVDGSLSSGSWEEGNNLGDELQFNDENGELNYEPYYFQKYGEKSGVLLDFDQIATKWGGDNAVRVKLDKTSDIIDRQFTASKDFIEKESGPVVFTAGRDQQFRKQRQARASDIEILTDAQAAAYGGKQDQYGYSDLPGQAHVPNKTFNHGRDNCRMSEISMLQPDGMRYTYGLPVYNTSQMEAVFSVDGQHQSHTDNNIAVPHSGTTITPYDGNITDQYLSETHMDQAYAHSWLLTTVVSSDYVDLTDNGPTDDDYGYWVKFNYEKTAPDYRWRVPYTGANYMQGHIDEYSDDKGSFTYGEKEVYFLKSVETKTHIATFATSDRQDGLEAYDKLEANETTRARYKMKRLDAVSLYTKGEYLAQTPTKPAVPIKIAHFKYNYNLCKGIKNSISANSVGKLTLEQVYFTYQNSNRGELSPYRFSYGGSEDNPSYNDKNMDRWGNYKENKNSSNQPYQNYPFLEFPYTQQDNEHPNVDAWTLQQIDLPTGGTIKVDYESDDYAYVESKRATHMFDIVSLGTPPNPGETPNRDAQTPSDVRTETHVNGDGKNYRVYFKLDMPDLTLSTLNQPERDAYVNEHLNGIKKVYFKTFANLDMAKHDFVTGYADLATGAGNSGCVKIGNDPSAHFYGYITLKSEDLKKYSISGQQVNPFTKAAIQHLRISRPELIYKASGTNSTNAMSQIQNLFGSIKGAGQDLTIAITGFNTWAFGKGYGQSIAVDGRSIIRLCDPDGKKYGGGVRVSRISISDNWDATNQNITNSSTGAALYGQKYDYTLAENGKTISSGVAYEPTIGGEESALRIPIGYEESTLLGTTSNLYLDKPLMESYYPGATVGYRKVTVTSIAPEQADLSDNNANDGSYKIERTTAPLTIYEFYSPKDFPVAYDETDMNADPAIIRPLIIPGFYSGFKKRKARSQGYSLVINDMAGKLKCITQRTSPTGTNPEGGFISKEEYIYNTEAPYSADAVNRLSNKVQVVSVDPNNMAQTVFQTGVLGQSHDVFVDMNENVQRSDGYGVDANLDLQVYVPTPPPPIFFIMPMIYASQNEVSMKTVVTTKVIYRTAILKKVITTSRESVVTRESLAFDLENGKPLLTKVTNEFEDPIYEQAYPAHWYYKNMGGAYKNYAFHLGSLNVSASSAGEINPGIAVSSFFNVGDELFVNNSYKAHIYEVDTGNNLIKLIKRDGGYISGTVNDLKVITSGRKNLLDAEVGKILSKQITGFNDFPGTSGIYGFNQFINASAVEYSDQWETICDRCGYDPTNAQLPKDPFITGESGLWRAYKSYAYKTDRAYSYGNEKSRSDGTYADFAYFPWYNPALRSAKWIATNTITKYSPYGYELENKDAIGNYSSALYGYNQSLSVAIAKNAQYKEIAFDGFEDYDFSDCQDHHLRFENDKNKISHTEKHTGGSSIRLQPGEKVELDASLKDCRP
jgi:hypothetical protein